MYLVPNWASAQGFNRNSSHILHPKVDLIFSPAPSIKLWSADFVPEDGGLKPAFVVHKSPLPVVPFCKPWITSAWAAVTIEFGILIQYPGFNVITIATKKQSKLTPKVFKAFLYWRLNKPKYIIYIAVKANITSINGW